MDINNQNQSSNTMPTRANMGGALGYDLKSEKQEIEEITREVKTELLAKWKKSYANAQIFPTQIASMHAGVVDFLLSFNMVSVYDNIAKQAGLDSKGRNVLPRVVWQIAQSKNWESLDQILETQIPLIHSVHVTVASLLNQEILNKVRAISEKPVAQKSVNEEILAKKEMEMPIAKALVDFPKVAEQNITGNPLRLRTMLDPVRPSIKNWISDFQDSLGARKHSPIDRGNFLFHSENGKKLTPIERQKLAIVLKSLDEETLLTIDVASERIIFGNVNDTGEQSSSINHQSQSMVNDIKIEAPIAHINNLDSRLRGNDNVETIGTIGARTGEEKMVAHKEERVEDFFQIPGSKPPIGSQDFHGEKIQGSNDSAILDDPDSISDDELFAKILQKKSLGTGRNIENKMGTMGMNSERVEREKIGETGQVAVEPRSQQKNFSPNFAVGNDKITFSSPQKLPAEQTAKPFQISEQQAPVQQPAPQANQTPTASSQQHSPFHIMPVGYMHDDEKNSKNDSLSRANGNIVDLRN